MWVEGGFRRRIEDQTSENIYSVNLFTFLFEQSGVLLWREGCAYDRTEG